MMAVRAREIALLRNRHSQVCYRSPFRVNKLFAAHVPVTSTGFCVEFDIIEKWSAADKNFFAATQQAMSLP
jgi:hypothetical protein